MTETPTTELVTYEPQGELVNRRDLRNRATDSWTDVLEEVGDLAARIANTDFVPATFKVRNDAGEMVGSVAAVAATILAGREIGFAPMTALSSMHSIKGKVGLYAEAMRALVFQAGHEIVFQEQTAATCTVRGRRHGSDQWTSVTWTLADARQAGLLNSNKNWQTYPRQMLAARASTELCRLAFPDVIRGLASVEELETLDLIPGAPGTEAIESGEGRKVKRTTKKAAAKPAEAPEPPLPEDNPTDGTVSDEGKPVEATPAQATDTAPPLPEDVPPTPSADSSDGVGSAVDESTGDPDVGGDATPEAHPTSGSPPEQEEIVDAEVVEDAEPRMSLEQRPALMAGFTKLGLGGNADRDERLQVTRDLIGRELGSANDLSVTEARSIIETLAMCDTRDDLENVIQATVAHRDGGA